MEASFFCVSRFKLGSETAMDIAALPSGCFITAPVWPTWSRRLSCRPFSLHKLAASLAADASQDVKVVEDENGKSGSLLACPICYKTLQYDGQIGAKKLRCKICNKVYSNNGMYLELTVTAGLKDYEEVVQTSTEMFRNPAISFIYERGFHQAFQIFGYPGLDEELKLANEFLKCAIGGIIIDLICASGLFTRRLAKSGLYSSVIGIDFSENMLEQFQVFVQNDSSLKNVDLLLVRADVGRLPFATGTIDAVHAGAALHCWPFPSNGVAEVSRVLKPGGVFVASTNIFDVIQPVKQAIRRSFGGRGLWTEKELQELCRSCGLVEFSSIRNLGFIMFSVRKPR